MTCWMVVLPTIMPHSFSSAVHLGGVRMGEVVGEPKVKAGFVEVEQVFRTIVSIDIYDTKREVGNDPCEKVSGRC